MEVGDWITLAAVLIALGLGVSSLIQTHRLQETERRERLLNEVIEWAVEVAKSGELDTPDLSNDKDAAKSWPFLDRQSKKLDILQLLMARRVGVEQIAQAINQSLKEAVEKVRQNLRDQFSNLSGYEGYVEGYKSKKVAMDTEYLRKAAQEVKSINILLYGNARKLIAEATKIKTGDIS